MRFLTIGVTFAAVTVLALMFAPPAIGAPIEQIFTFHGVCDDCEGSVYAELRLTGGYVVGQDILPEHFVSFHYGGSNLFEPYTITASHSVLIFGVMTGNPGPADFVIQVMGDDRDNGEPSLSEIDLSGYFFVTCTDSSFCSSDPDGFWETGIWQVPADYGFSHTWSPAGTPGAQIPEPATFTLLGAGLVAFALIRRRARA